jgi:hypothetical protein
MTKRATTATRAQIHRQFFWPSFMKGFFDFLDSTGVSGLSTIPC